ncbi:helix-turn-helix transcriptional regulator [Paenibacillus sp. 1P07SE]|uniref:helix-turn-helix transcriptional regulator n=1 Tax=Paenibacillus sp. 1P07SE TaxID=3132209 RepID=UPI0039A5C51E
MKIDRLLAIVVLLMNKRMVQAKELAELFEVSVRTIYRDVDTIDQAGIPIVTYQGAGGGIGIAEGYRLDRNLLTNDEFAAIATALRSVGTTYDGHRNNLLLEKINSIIPAAQAEEYQIKSNQLLLDYSPWGAPALFEEKLDLLKEAIERKQLVTFSYSSAQGEMTLRTAEPHTILLKGQHWYVYAYCTKREQFRIFKLMRMQELAMLEQRFTRRQVEPGLQPSDQEWNKPDQTVALSLRFRGTIKHLVEERFGPEALQEADGGDVLIHITYPENNWLYGFILSFGDDVEVLGPPHIREIIGHKAAAIAMKYQNELQT